jgi:LysM repeat protein
LLYPNAYFRSLSLDDVNGDGRAEVIAAASGAQTMYVYQVLAVGADTRLEELGRLYIGGLVSARPIAGGEVATGTKDGFVDVFVPCALLPKQNQVIYTVRRGDSLWRLAKKFNTSPGAVARANKLTEPYQLTPGQVLIIPGPRPPRPN